MSFRGNGRRRNARFVFASIFIFIIGLICLLMAYRNDWKVSWIIVSAAVIFISGIMFKNANEQ